MNLKKICYHVSALMIASLAMTACTNTISHQVTRDGTVEPSDLIFPDVNKAWQKDGQFPNRENLSKIKPGVGKDDLYQLIGRPHFSETHGAQEWDYIFKFYQPDNSIKICQYKVIFDKDYKAQSFYWLPVDCTAYAEPQTTVVAAPTVIVTPAAPAPVIAPEPVVKEHIDLSADALFAFDKWRAQDMLPGGQEQLRQLADKLRQYQEQGDMRLVVTGHTDRFGSAEYNMNLSQLRAQTVRQFLMTQGIASSAIIAQGVGESEPVTTQCPESMPRQQAIQCLQPDRRVSVDVTVYSR